MAKFLYGTVDLTEFTELTTESHSLYNGKLVFPGTAVGPSHEVSVIELPDGALPLTVLPPMPGDKEGGDILVWYKPL